MIVIAAYHRRRGWLAYHSGGAAMGKRLKLSDFMGQTDASKPQTPDQMLANLRKFKAGLGKPATD